MFSPQHALIFFVNRRRNRRAERQARAAQMPIARPERPLCLFKEPHRVDPSLSDPLTKAIQVSLGEFSLLRDYVYQKAYLGVRKVPLPSYPMPSQPIIKEDSKSQLMSDTRPEFKEPHQHAMHPPSANQHGIVHMKPGDGRPAPYVKGGAHQGHSVNRAGAPGVPSPTSNSQETKKFINDG